MLVQLRRNAGDVVAKQMSVGHGMVAQGSADSAPERIVPGRVAPFLTAVRQFAVVLPKQIAVFGHFQAAGKPLIARGPAPRPQQHVLMAKVLAPIAGTAPKADERPTGIADAGRVRTPDAAPQLPQRRQHDRTFHAAANVVAELAGLGRVFRRQITIDVLECLRPREQRLAGHRIDVVPKPVLVFAPAFTGRRRRSTTITTCHPTRHTTIRAFGRVAGARRSNPAPKEAMAPVTAARTSPSPGWCSLVR